MELKGENLHQSINQTGTNLLHVTSDKFEQHIKEREEFLSSEINTSSLNLSFQMMLMVRYRLNVVVVLFT